MNLRAPREGGLGMITAAPSETPEPPIRRLHHEWTRMDTNESKGSHEFRCGNLFRHDVGNVRIRLSSESFVSIRAAISKNWRELRKLFSSTLMNRRDAKERREESPLSSLRFFAVLSLQIVPFRKDSFGMLFNHRGANNTESSAAPSPCCSRLCGLSGCSCGGGSAALGLGGSIGCHWLWWFRRAVFIRGWKFLPKSDAWIWETESPLDTPGPFTRNPSP